MKKHCINIEATGTKDELIKFLEMTIKLIQTAKNLSEKDKDFEIINGTMSDDEIQCTNPLNTKTMATKKKLYHKRIVVDVLSETPIPDSMTLADLEHEYSQGDYVGCTETKKNQIVSGRKAAKMVMDMGSDPMFFQMNEFGNEIEEDSAFNNFISKADYPQE